MCRPGTRRLSVQGETPNFGPAATTSGSLILIVALQNAFGRVGLEDRHLCVDQRCSDGHNVTRGDPISPAPLVGKEGSSLVSRRRRLKGQRLVSSTDPFAG